VTTTSFIHQRLLLLTAAMIGLLPACDDAAAGDAYYSESGSDVGEERAVTAAQPETIESFNLCKDTVSGHFTAPEHDVFGRPFCLPGSILMDCTNDKGPPECTEALANEAGSSFVGEEQTTVEGEAGFCCRVYVSSGPSDPNKDTFVCSGHNDPDSCWNWHPCPSGTSFDGCPAGGSSIGDCCS